MATLCFTGVAARFLFTKFSLKEAKGRRDNVVFTFVQLIINVDSVQA